MSYELQLSREELVRAGEEERRRLRRDLHDGIGPQLAAMAMQLDSLSDGLAARGDDLASRAATLSVHLRSTVRDVRHVVDNLRPPALDDLGLVGALRHLVDPLAPTVTFAADTLPALPAATEVAAYRIAAEALTNAVRHSGCATCSLRLRSDDAWLTVEVHDNGRGLGPRPASGVGLRSMRERAGEVGGRLEVSDAATGGTVVRARLPLAAGR